MSNTPPVENEHSSEDSQATSAAISSTSRKSAIGIFDSVLSIWASVIQAKMSVRATAGVTQVTRIPIPASSVPSDFLSPITLAPSAH
jgi:hypothetical protein